VGDRIDLAEHIESQAYVIENGKLKYLEKNCIYQNLYLAPIAFYLPNSKLA